MWTITILRVPSSLSSQCLLRKTFRRNPTSGKMSTCKSNTILNVVATIVAGEALIHILTISACTKSSSSMMCHPMDIRIVT